MVLNIYFETGRSRKKDEVAIDWPAKSRFIVLLKREKTLGELWDFDG